MGVMFDGWERAEGIGSALSIKLACELFFCPLEIYGLCRIVPGKGERMFQRSERKKEKKGKTLYRCSRGMELELGV